MRTSSFNSLMIGIAISDLFVILDVVKFRTFEWLFHNKSCIYMYSYNNQLSEITMDFLSKTSMKSSFWLGVFLAFLRLLTMKSCLKLEFFGKPYTGYIIFIMIFSISAFIPAQLFIHQKIEVVRGSYQIDSDCVYNEKYQLYHVNDGLAFDLQDFDTACTVFSDITIAILYPILALFMYSELRNSADRISNVSRSAALGRYKRCKIVLFLTISYIICTVPQGMLQLMYLLVSFDELSLLKFVAEYGEVTVSILFCWTAISQCIICYKLSSSYRSTVKKMFGFRKGFVMQSVEGGTTGRI
ncbi:hypothetical protein CAEBREN_18497 [Caenorhabditis brenneri]|uniref:G-protein coupled receptors family 1 profile domain-containing protein n=1 Tax=Caenorhabditis brenneri TaxID=135651 RepID=G0M9R4_CAEBE|nr:hypothetical protein CAEBREN_18497 [Caenorhabditis brenneri]